MGAAVTGLLTATQSGRNWRVWRLRRPLTCEVENGPAITVPAGFVTDGASVPRFLWWLLPAWGRYARAAVIHDYLYHRLEAGEPHPAAPTRRDADRVFLEAMQAAGVAVPVYLAMWAAVRAFGGSTFCKRLAIAREDVHA